MAKLNLRQKIILLKNLKKRKLDIVLEEFLVRQIQVKKKTI